MPDKPAHWYALAGLEFQLGAAQIAWAVFGVLAIGAVNLAVQNLFNKDYIDYNSQTRSYDALSYFAGRGRSFTLGWDYRF